MQKRLGAVPLYTVLIMSETVSLFLSKKSSRIDCGSEPFIMALMNFLPSTAPLPSSPRM